MKASSRVVFNTGVQYARTFIGACIAFYSSRIILKSLGASDYGIYNLVAGVITFLGVINIALSSSTQRYLSFYQGKNDGEMQAKIFNNSIVTQLAIGLILAIGMFILTPFIFDGFLNIPSDRIHSATAVYYSLIVTVFFSMLTMPYMAALVAHENIVFSSIVQIADALLKLIIALSLLSILSDRLIYYAIMMAVIAFLDFCVYVIYCRNRYEECRHFTLKSFDKKLLKEIFVFSGWMIYGTVCVVGRTQGIAVIFNQFFGTMINAAYGIAQQLSGQATFISNSLLNAIRPQIIKAEGGLDREKMLRLAEIASKFSLLLLSIIAIPAVFEMDNILNIWLENVPDHTKTFCQFVLLTALADQLTIGLAYASQAIGNIKGYSLAINTIKIITLPAAYLCLHFGLQPAAVMVCMLSFEFICAISRLFFLKKTAGLPITGFIKRVFVPEFIPVVCTTIVCWASHLILPYYLFWIPFLLSAVTICITTYKLGLCEDEKQIINNVLAAFKTGMRRNITSQKQNPEP
ncbi:hypothetical protein QEG73_14210 [Chitinophagaceae bacterium 26-R-25]|nr:hypothetical protein [Chitinophagaceae bacterium 26-R-25]